MKKIILSTIGLYLFIGCCLSSNLSIPALPIIATYVADHDQECKAEALIKSIRLFGGSAQNAEVLVIIGKNYNYTDKRLDLDGVKIIQIEEKLELPKLPYIIKAYAAAAAEKEAEGKTDLLMWFDPETIVVGELTDLQLAYGKQIALRPVFLSNKVALNPNQKPDLFWSEIYKQTKIDSTQIYNVNTVVEETPIKAYFNCGVMSVNPSFKLFQKWADLQTEMLKNDDFVKKALTDVPHQIFFHQAVFTVAILASTKSEQIEWISLKCAYPFNLHEKMPEGKKISNLNQVNSMILEDVWNSNPKWYESLTMSDDIKKKLGDLYKP